MTTQKWDGLSPNGSDTRIMAFRRTCFVSCPYDGFLRSGLDSV